MSATNSSTIFKEKYKALNKAQKEAVDAIESPVMVVAGPGTGKTTILTLHIANILLQTQATPGGVLALTFTDAGVKSMKRKLRQIIGSRADEVRIHTFHSFAGSVFSEFPDHFPQLFRTKQVTDIEAESMIRKILKSEKFGKLRPFGEPDYYVGKILKAISDAKKENQTPENIAEFAKQEIERIKSDPESISSRGPTKGKIKAEAVGKIEKCERTVLFAEVYRAYEAQKKAEKLLDYDDLLIELLKALEQDTQLLSELQEKFQYVHIDEHQDTNESQNTIVMKLVDFFDTPNIFIVGDEKQAIYRFQGASVKNFLTFQSKWKNMKVIKLLSNYRSHQAILDATFKMIENNYDIGEHKDLRVKLVGSGKERPVDVVNTPDTHTQDEYVVKRIKEIEKEDGEASIAIIVRKNREVEHILSVCERNGINASAERGVNIFESPTGTLFFDILEYVNDPTNIEALSNTVVRGLWNMDFQKSLNFINKARSRDIEIEKEIPGIKTILKEINTTGVINFLILVADTSGYGEVIKQSPVSAEVWRSIVDLAKDIAERNSIDDPKKLVTELLNYRKTAESKSIKIGSGSITSKVQIITAHSSKGLEYDYVIMPNVTEESWMAHNFGNSFVFSFQKDDGDEIKDSRRLFYVAMTRAKKHVELVVPEENSGGRELTPLRFIEELDSNHVKQKSIERVKERPLELPLGYFDELRLKEAQEYTKRVIVEKGLSVTALNHFMNCGREFFYKSILKIPEAPSVSSEKGIAMHKALSLVWREEDRSAKNIEKTILEVTEEYFKTSLLPKFEKDIVREEIKSYAVDVARELQDYFAFSGQTFVEKWEEKEFIAKYKGEEVVFNLHGQLDAILVDDHMARIFDYKTTEVKSVSSIKGETKSSDGNYFRQLVFYKLLLTGSHNYKDKEIEPALIFVKPNASGKCPTVVLPILEADVLQVKSEVEKLVESVWSGEFLQNECDDKDCKYCKFSK
jgi:DNA helicase-2/ATP-dependent DNA helicase PcrA